MAYCLADSCYWKMVKRTNEHMFTNTLNACTTYRTYMFMWHAVYRHKPSHECAHKAYGLLSNWLTKDPYARIIPALSLALYFPDTSIHRHIKKKRSKDLQGSRRGFWERARSLKPESDSQAGWASLPGVLGPKYTMHIIFHWRSLGCLRSQLLQSHRR